jgi:hypothetical protein
VRLNFTSTEQYDFKGGSGRQSGVIFMPLSPKHLMFTQVGYNLLIEEHLDLRFASQLQRYPIEHAHRFIFSRNINRQDSMWRPRTVNSDALSAEAAQWAKWHAEQPQAELELLHSR